MGHAFTKSEENSQDETSVEMKATLSLITDNLKVGTSKPLKEEGRRYGTSEAISSKYAAVREQSRQANARPVEKNIASAKVSLLDVGNTAKGTSSGLVSKWESMKNGFQNFKAIIGNESCLPLHQMQETKLVSRDSSTESLDEIFQRLKQPSVDPEDGRHCWITLDLCIDSLLL